MKNYLLILFLLILVAVAGIFYFGLPSVSIYDLPKPPAIDTMALDTVRELSPADLERIQKEKELNEGLGFLHLEYEIRKNLLGEQVIEGKIQSTADYIRYKDPELEIIFISKTMTKLGSAKRVIFEYIEPGKSIPFKVKVKGPKGTEIVETEVIKVLAEPADSI